MLFLSLDEHIDRFISTLCIFQLGKRVCVDSMKKKPSKNVYLLFYVGRRYKHIWNVCKMYTQNQAVILQSKQKKTKSKCHSADPGKVDWKIIHALAACLNSISIKRRYLCKSLILLKECMSLSDCDARCNWRTNILFRPLILQVISKSFSKFV